MADDSFEEFRQYQALHNLGSTMGFSTLIEAHKMANLALSMAMEFTGAGRGFLLLYNEKGRVRYCFGIDLDQKASHNNPPDDVGRIIEETRDERRTVRGGADSGEGRTHLSIPMIVEEEVIGVLYLDRAGGGQAFEPKEVKLADMAAGQLGISITARILYERMIEKRKQVELLDKIGKAVNSPVDLDNVLSVVVDTAREALGAEGAVLLLAEEGAPLEVRCAAGIEEDLLDENLNPLAARLIRTSLADETPKVHPPLHETPGEDAHTAKGTQPFSSVAVPVKLTLRDKRIFNERRRTVYSVPFTKVLGVLYLENRTQTKEFTEDDQFVLQVFADHVTTAVTNDSLYQQASTDTLTGLASRRYLDSRLGDEVDFARRTTTPLSVVLIDLDDFKWLNDTYGHQAGDEILRQVGQILRRSVRKFDICGRYGGEEFILALPETDTPGARVVAENVRERVASEAFLDPENPVLVTVSLGIATFPAHASDLHGLVGAADAALYQSKRAGKNCHRIAGEETT